MLSFWRTSESRKQGRHEWATYQETKQRNERPPLSTLHFETMQFPTMFSSFWHQLRKDIYFYKNVQDQQDRLGLRCGALDVSEMQAHVEHNYCKPFCLSHLSPAVTLHLFHLRAPSPWRPVEWSFSFPWMSLYDTWRPTVVSKMSNVPNRLAKIEMVWEQKWELKINEWISQWVCMVHETSSRNALKKPAKK